MKRPFTPLATARGIVSEGNPAKHHRYQTFLKMWQRHDETKDRVETAVPNFTISSNPRKIVEDVFVFHRANLEKTSLLDNRRIIRTNSRLLIQPGILKSGRTYVLQLSDGTFSFLEFSFAFTTYLFFNAILLVTVSGLSRRKKIFGVFFLW